MSRDSSQGLYRQGEPNPRSSARAPDDRHIVQQRLSPLLSGTPASGHRRLSGHAGARCQQSTRTGTRKTEWSVLRTRSRTPLSPARLRDSLQQGSRCGRFRVCSAR